jgi:hypothetical protein
MRILDSSKICRSPSEFSSVDFPWPTRTRSGTGSPHPSRIEILATAKISKNDGPRLGHQIFESPCQNHGRHQGGPKIIIPVHFATFLP